MTIKSMEAALAAKYPEPLTSPGLMQYTMGDLHDAYRTGWEAREAWVPDIEWSNMASSGEYVPASTERWAWKHFADTGARVFWREQGDPLWHEAIPARMNAGSES